MPRPTYSAVTATLALLVAVGGTSYAASLPKNSVGTAQLKNDAVTASKIKDGVVQPGFVPSTTLQSGKTLTGVYSAAMGQAEYDFIPVTFRPRLASGITPAKVVHLGVGATTAECPGPGKAEKGWFCAYDTYSNLTYVGTANPTVGQDNKGSSPDGIVLQYSHPEGGVGTLTGVWAVTAP